jgi:hypothetical protein
VLKPLEEPCIKKHSCGDEWGIKMRSNYFELINLKATTGLASYQIIPCLLDGFHGNASRRARNVWQSRNFFS